MVDATTNLLRRRGVEVFLLTRHSRGLESSLAGKVRAFICGIYSLHEYSCMARFIQQKRPDVVHVHNLYPLFSPSILVACRRAGVPVVLHCHTYHLTCPTTLNLLDGRICERCCCGREYWCVLKNCRGNFFESVGYALRSAVARKFRLFKDNVTLFIALGEFFKPGLVAGGFKKEQIVVIPNMVSIPDSPVDSSQGEYVAYAGRISPEKGIYTLMAAARETRLPVRLTGDYSAMPEIFKTVPQNAQFTGYLSPRQLVQFYRKARFSVVPSLWLEPFGLVAAEAMSHGLPVIASKIGGLPEVVEDGVTGLLFEPGKVEDLVNKIKYLWENPKLCRRMGQAARDRVIREFSEDVYYKRLMTVYKKAIEINNELKQHKAKS